MAASAPDPLLFRPHGLEFSELDDLRAYLERVLGYSQASLRHYFDNASGGFHHRIDPGVTPTRGNWSKASTATCLAYLGASGALDEEPWKSGRREIRKRMANTSWKSAGLKQNNPFTTSFLLEGIHAASDGGRELTPSQRRVVQQKLRGLNRALQAVGGLSVDPYPATAFLTQKAVRVLRAWDALSDASRSAVENWTWNHLRQESVLVASDERDADVFELAYSVLTASLVVRLDRMTPQQRGLLQYAIDQFFDAQKEDGTWPRSRPLFLYPGLGYAYCFDYELLVQLLSDRQLTPHVFGRLKQLMKAAFVLDERKYPLVAPVGSATAAFGWSSGHHGSDPRAESWSTASVFHYCFELDRLVAEALRRGVFDYAKAKYSPPRDPISRARFLEGFLDSRVGNASLRSLIVREFLSPLVANLDVAARGRALPKAVPVSAIFFGPPGTSKTELAKKIASALGWPLLMLDPSHLTRGGLDQVHAEAHRLFTMLQASERIVVLLDEFDELFQEREYAGEIESRFLTTAMLPKLAALAERRRVVFLLATNHLERFDAAIRRRGRFDMILPVMPPTAAAKIREWPTLGSELNSLQPTQRPRAREQLALLTYGETEALVSHLGKRKPGQRFDQLLGAEAAGATLNQIAGPAPSPGTAAGESWLKRMKRESSKMRLPLGS